MKALVLDQDELIDFELYGIIATYNDPVQLVYHINHCFETRFERGSDLDVMIEDSLTYFPIFEWEDPFSEIIFSVIKNSGYTLEKNNKGNQLSQLFELTPILIPNYKDYNFLLRVENDEAAEIPLKENHFIQKITKLRTEKIKSIERLIF